MFSKSKIAEHSFLDFQVINDILMLALPATAKDFFYFLFEAAS